MTVRNLPFKSYSTTGSMSAGSPTLTVASNPGFAIGDQIIVEIGGEVGAGLRGTEGVGGSWPSLGYADAATMAADLSQVNNRWAFARDTGIVYQFATGTNTWTSYASYGIWYLQKVVPRSLVTTITNIVGTTFTLNNSAVKATTNANVYYDNVLVAHNYTYSDPPFDPIIAQLGDTLVIPSGTYAFSRTWQIDSTLKNIVIYGQGIANTELFSPRGVNSFQIIFEQCDALQTYDYTLRGNVKFNGFGFDWVDINGIERATNQTSPADETPYQYPPGLRCHLLDGGDVWNVRNIRVYDVWQKAVCSDQSSNVWAKDCSCYMTEGLNSYIQWMMHWADSTDGICQDCTVDSAELTCGFEAFSSNNIRFVRPVGRNAVCSMNGTHNTYWEEGRWTIEANSAGPNFTSFDWGHVPVMQINDNIGRGTGPAFIRNPTIIIEGAVNVGAVQQCMAFSFGPVTVTGGYPCHPGQGGLLQRYDTPAQNRTHFAADASNAVLYGVRCVGQSLGQVDCNATGTVAHCVVDSFASAPLGSVVNNITNTQYANGQFICEDHVPKISELPGGVTLTGSELLAAVQTGITSQITPQQINRYVGQTSPGLNIDQITQSPLRTSTVLNNGFSGLITLASAAGSTTPTSFTVTNTSVAANDIVIVNQKSGTDRYIIAVTAVAAGSFQITFYTTGGTTTEQPVFGFRVIKS